MWDIVTRVQKNLCDRPVFFAAVGSRKQFDLLVTCQKIGSSFYSSAHFGEAVFPDGQFVGSFAISPANSPRIILKTGVIRARNVCLITVHL